MLLPEDHGAVLPVEGEVVNGDGAGATVDGWREPVHTAVRGHQRVAVQRHLKLPVHTAHTHTHTDTHTHTHRHTHRHTQTPHSIENIRQTDACFHQADRCIRVRSLVLQDDVRQPDALRGDSEFRGQVAIEIRPRGLIPSQPVITPFLPITDKDKVGFVFVQSR